MLLQFRAECVHHLVREAVDKDYAVWIAHGYGGDFHSLSGDVDRGVKHSVCIEIHRYVGWRGHGQPHVYGHGFDKSVRSRMQLQRLDAAECFDCKMVGFRDMIVGHIFGYAADAVATHLGFCTVGVENSHAAVGFVTWQYGDDAIGVEACMSVAHLDGE